MYRDTWIAIKADENSSNTEYPNWTTKYTTEMGMCYSYRVPDYLKLAEVRHITFYAKKNFDIHLHHPGQFLSWDVHSFPMRLHQGIYVESSHEVTQIGNKIYL